MDLVWGVRFIESVVDGTIVSFKMALTYLFAVLCYDAVQELS